VSLKFFQPNVHLLTTWEESNSWAETSTEKNLSRPNRLPADQ